MLHLITGGSGSGKSAYAEEQVQKAGDGQRIYIATMIPYGEEGRQRVARHRQMRKEKCFETIECYMNLASVKVPENSIVLLECMSNLVANEIFEIDGAHEDTVNAVCRGIDHLMTQTQRLFVVTNEIFSDGITYDQETMRYLEYLGRVNQNIAALSDQVTEVIYGIPVTVK